MTHLAGGGAQVMPSFVTTLDSYKTYADLCLGPDSSTCVLLFTDKYVNVPLDFFLRKYLVCRVLCGVDEGHALRGNVRRKSTPPLYSALSRDYKDHLTFAIVRTAAADAQPIIAEFAPVIGEKVAIPPPEFPTFQLLTPPHRWHSSTPPWW